MRIPLPLLVPVFLVTIPALAETPATSQKSPTLAVLPFIPVTAKDKDLAEDFRRRVSLKASHANFFARKDNVEVEAAVSALGVLTTEPYADEDLAKIIDTLHTDYTLVASVEGRKIAATLYAGKDKVKSTFVTVPGGKDSPKIALEQLWTDLVGDKARFDRVRAKEVDHDNAAFEKRFADPANPNLAPDPAFEFAVKDPAHTATSWGAILGSSRHAPKLMTEADAASLPADRAAVVPVSAAGTAEGLPKAAQSGHCLMMRVSKNTAENNGLACESTWIPVEHGKTYRFSVAYHSTGPVPRLFLKGFGYLPDQFGDKNDPEAVRREVYRMQVQPRQKNKGWDLIEADFTPSTNKPTDPKVQWLRVDLYVYFAPGDVFFDNVTVKKVAD